MKQPAPILHIIATRDGIADVGLYCRGAESVRFYEALLPALDAIDAAIGQVLKGDDVAATSVKPVAAIN